MAVKDESTVARGRKAEQLTAQWYVEQGAQVLCMNYRIRGGEIDLIVRDEGCIAFVEVKMRASNTYGTPAEAVTPAKRRLICRAALRYAQENGLMDEYMRFDVAGVYDGHVSVYKNAFDFVE